MSFAIIAFALMFATGAPPIAGAATPAAGLPTPIPFALPPITAHQLTWAEQYPGLTMVIEVLFLIATIGIIALMSVQTTKTEGLSGSIGGRAESAYHGRLGLDQQITRITSITACAWIALAVVFFFVTR